MSPDANAWTDRYRRGETPWDLHGPHPEIVARVAEDSLPDRAEFPRVLVAGCGPGHDALALAHAGYEVTALDIVEDLAPQVGPALKEHGGRFIVADAFEFSDEPFDWAWEHTFFCAIEPERRDEYGELMSRLIRRGGKLCANVFPSSHRALDAPGPPWTISTEILHEALGSKPWEIEYDELMENPVPRREHAERYAVFRRR